METKKKRFMNIDIMEAIKKQGLSFLLLAVAVIWFNAQYVKLNAKVDKCNQAIIQELRIDRTELTSIINRNSRALEELKLK